MKKYFFILLCVFASLSATGQVTIPNEVARYFLEQDERAKQLDTLLVVKQKRIENLTERVRLKGLVEKTRITDVKTYLDIIKVKDEQIAFKNKRLVLSDKEVRKQYRQKSTVLGLGIGAAAGSFVGQPVVGAVIGGGVGFVVGLFKKKKYA